MEMETKRPAPLYVCLRGAPGHVDGVYELGSESAKQPYKRLKC